MENLSAVPPVITGWPHQGSSPKSNWREATQSVQLCLPLTLFLWGPFSLRTALSHFHCQQAEKTSSPFYRRGPEAHKESGASTLVFSWDQECTFEVTLVPVPTQPCFASQSSRAWMGSVSIESNQTDCSRNTSYVFKPLTGIQSLGWGQS